MRLDLDSSVPALPTAPTFDPGPFLRQLPDEPVTSAQLDEIGLTWRQRDELIRTGLLRRPIRSVYVKETVADDLPGRIAVLRLVVPQACVVTDRTAAWLWGATTALAPGDHLVVPQVSVFCPPGHRLRNGLTDSGERRLTSSDVADLDGVRVTTPLRTSCDLGRLLHLDQALAALDALAALGRFSLEALRAEVGRFKGYRGVVQLRALVTIVDPRSGSPMESVLRMRWYQAGLPRPQCQVAVPGPNGQDLWLDIGLPEELFGAEYDGEEFHGPEQQQHDSCRRAWVRDNYGWRLVVARRANVIGRGQDIERTLRRSGPHTALTDPPVLHRRVGGEVAAGQR